MVQKLEAFAVIRMTKIVATSVSMFSMIYLKGPKSAALLVLCSVPTNSGTSMRHMVVEGSTQLCLVHNS